MNKWRERLNNYTNSCNNTMAIYPNLLLMLWRTMLLTSTSTMKSKMLPRTTNLKRRNKKLKKCTMNSRSSLQVLQVVAAQAEPMNYSLKTFKTNTWRFKSLLRKLKLTLRTTNQAWLKRWKPTTKNYNKISSKLLFQSINLSYVLKKLPPLKLFLYCKQLKPKLKVTKIKLVGSLAVSRVSTETCTPMPLSCNSS